MNSDWLDIDILEDYLDGKLDARAMHKIEKQALEDPFVAQALAGLSESPKRARGSVSLLQKQLYERISQQQVQKKETVFTWQRLSVAAAAAVMFISVSILFFMREKENREQQAKGHTKKVEVNMAPSPSGVDSAKEEVYAAVTPVPMSVPQRINPKNKTGDLMAADQMKAADGTRQIQDGQQKIAEVTDKDTAGTAVIATSKAAVARVATVIAPAISVPAGGWAKFDSYLNDNNKLIANGKSGKVVELSFTIDSEGNPSDLRIEKGALKDMDDEALRLIKEGPKWEVPKSSVSRVTYTVAF